MDFRKERLLGRFASAQGIETDMFMGKVDLTTDQAMQPMLGDAVVVAQQIDITVLGAATHEDHGAGQWSAQVESEAIREAAPLGSGLATNSGFGAVGDDVARRDILQGRQVAEVMALPDLGLPKGVEALDSILEPRRARGANTGTTRKAKHSRLTRPTVSANWCAPWKIVSLSNWA